MEESVDQTDDWTLRIINSSRLFLNPSGEPIPVADCISFGVKHDLNLVVLLGLGKPHSLK
jgi:hypothetical protein